MSIHDLIQAFDPVQFVGCVMGIVGAYFAGSTKHRLRFRGFTFFTLSNGFWISWGIIHCAWWLLLMQLFYVVTSFRGLINNNRRPLAEHYYEAHVTLDPVMDPAPLVQLQSICNDHGFRVAKLFLGKADGDFLPSDVDSFTTSRSKNYYELRLAMSNLIVNLESVGFHVRRYKIEDTLVDSKISDSYHLLDPA